MVAKDVGPVVTAAYAPVYATQDLAERRHAYDAMQPDPSPGTTVEEAVVGGVRGRWIAAPEAGPDVVLYLHGGAYLLGSSLGYRGLAARVSAATRSRLFVPDYSLAPESPFPGAYDDTLAVYRALVKDKQVQPENIVLMGDSAGGGLALATALGLRECGDPLPAALVALSPFADLTVSGASYGRNDDDPIGAPPERTRQAVGAYVGDADPTDWRISPLFGDFAGLPPILLQAASCERLLDDAVRVAERVRAAGGVVDLQIYYEAAHVFQMFFADLPQAARAIDEVGLFVARHRCS
ncbi:alpha/beta hydrolase [Mycobacterium syngnathidarum]